MHKQSEKTIWTIGHSTHPMAEFISMLKGFGIEQLVDIRRFPGSKRYPYFNKTDLENTLKELEIKYIHMEGLGGRRKPNPGSLNVAWRHPAFRAYADYMETDEFKRAFKELLKIALIKPTAYMCSEAVWWRCHRSLVSDCFKANGWKVLHIMNFDKFQEHPYSTAAKIVDGQLSYKN